MGKLTNMWKLTYPWKTNRTMKKSKGKWESILKQLKMKCNIPKLTDTAKETPRGNL